MEEEDYNDFVEAQDETIDLEDEKNELKEEAAETEKEIEEGDYSIPEDEGEATLALVFRIFDCSSTHRSIRANTFFFFTFLFRRN